ncbi:hypothetical protein [Burkholderia contaminans]|nr:hypothetical protein [Burkholderia contaminans]
MTTEILGRVDVCPLALAADQRVHEMQQGRGHARFADGFVQRP